MTRALSALALVLVLIGCAGKPTPYQPKADRTGYSQQKLDAQTWRVQFTGNINTPRETVENYLLYRSAEIMLFGGYEKFVMLEKDIERNVEYRDTGYYPHFGYGLRRGRHHGHHHGLRYYGPVYYSPLVSYSGTATIRIYSGGPPPNNAPVYDAQEIVQQLGPIGRASSREDITWSCCRENVFSQGPERRAGTGRVSSMRLGPRRLSQG